MKKTISLLSNLLLSSTLLWGVPSLNAQVVNGQESIVNDPTGIPDYCRMNSRPRAKRLCLGYIRCSMRPREISSISMDHVIMTQRGETRSTLSSACSFAGNIDSE